MVESNSSDGTRASSRDTRPTRASGSSSRTPPGEGRGRARGIQARDRRIILIQDADLEYSVEDYPKLIEPIMRGDVDFTLGCRHVPGEPVRVMDGCALLRRS